MSLKNWKTVSTEKTTKIEKTAWQTKNFLVLLKSTFEERYRSGHNEAVLKTVCPQGRVGSNPTLSVSDCFAAEIRLNDFRDAIQINTSWLNQLTWRSTQEAEGTPLERVQVVNSGARVQIPPSPFAAIRWIYRKSCKKSFWKKCLTVQTTCDKISTVAAEKAAHRTLTNKQ